MNSTAILYGDDAALPAALTACRWHVTVTTDISRALDMLDPHTALVVLDVGAPGAADLLQRIRSRPQPAGGVPILQHGGDRLAGTSALLPPPGDPAVTVAAIERFTGALDDHRLRRPPFSPFYRLVRLLGTRDAAAMIDRFAEALRTTLAEPPSNDRAHRLAGLAGAIGYADLALAWRAAEQRADALDAAVAATHATLAAIARDAIGRYRASD